MRATMLICVSVVGKGVVDKDDGAPFEGPRNEAEDCGIFHDIDSKCQSKMLIITISA